MTSVLDDPGVQAYVAKQQQRSPDTSRRARLIRFIERAGDHRHQLKIGTRRAAFARLSTDALEDLAIDVANDFWADRQLRREHRTVFASKQKGALSAETHREAAREVAQAFGVVS